MIRSLECVLVSSGCPNTLTQLTFDPDASKYDRVVQMWFARRRPSMGQHHINQTTTGPVAQ